MKHLKIYIYFALKIFLLIMGWIFYQQKSMVSYSEVFDPSLQAESSHSPINFYYSIILIITFLLISGLLVHEYLQLMKNKAAKKEEKSTSEFLKNDSEAKPEPVETLMPEESKKLDSNPDKEKLFDSIKKEIPGESENNIRHIGENVLSCISKIFELTQAEIFIKELTADGKTKFKLLATYAIYVHEDELVEFDLGEGLIGQAGQTGKNIYLDNLPEGFLSVKTGLGRSDPGYLLIIPWKDKKGDVFAVLEMASFKPFEKKDIDLLESISAIISSHFIS